MKKIILAILSFLLIQNTSLFSVDKANLEYLFQKANESYSKGDYHSAIDLYQKILSSGYMNKAVLFNLGNCYYRLGEYHKSILFFERAKKLDPFDEDIKFNLQMANLHTVDRIQEIPKFFLKQWWEDVRDSLASRQWATVSTVSIWLAFLALTIFLFVFSPKIRKISFFVGLFLLMLFLISTIFGYSRYKYETSHNEAIIFSINAYIKSSPEENSTDLFILHQGTKIEILDKIGNWYKIRLANGNIGWIKGTEIERI
ncbi:MAG: tetratricopeptide repeat protein [Candidatus Kapaibacteriota bacterium]